ncbi:unnamed protein product [Adineta steineri]|uniref:Riboflavin transporter n=1 Tax=Adineta steineri TaxID=433720 RepID=A0A813PLP0_9BILA|nr:unnamed protein product [Adineta steineri]CAF0860974.1 unnamed protein product [Adineta steineri]CAF3970140.1 unnamed protein product [Adineta steineri]CAF3980923.1 unnamed protein product [Adineta steineri]
MSRFEGHNSTTIVFILITIFALCQNIFLCGIDIELPVIVHELPEGWSLPAIFNIVINHIINLHLYDTISIIIILSISVVGLICLALTWNKITLIENKYHSTYFLFFTFVIYSCQYTGILLFLPYIDRYKLVMIRAFFLGDAITSVSIAGLAYAQDSPKSECISVIQGNQTILIEKKSPLTFSVETYFFIISGMMLSSLICFLILSITKIGQNKNNENDENKILIEKDNQVEEIENKENLMNKRQFKLSNNVFYLFAMFWSCFATYGFLPSLQTYALLPYSPDVYQKTIIAVEIAYVFAQIFCATFSKLTVVKYPKLVHIFNLISTILIIWIFIIAKMSPCPPLINNALLGGTISGLLYTTVNGLSHINYILLSVYFQEEFGKTGLFWGCVTLQTGMTFGALIIFVLTFHFNIFKERFACVDYQC